MPRKKSLFCQPACSSLTSQEWAWNAQFHGNHSKERLVMAAGKPDGSCLSGPHSRECDRFYFPSKGRTAGLPGVCENKSAAARNEKWPWQDEELHFPSCLYTGLNGHKVRTVNPWRSKPLKSRWWKKPTMFQEARGQWGQALCFLVSVIQSPVSSIHILQNNCISTGKNHFKCPGPFRQAIVNNHSSTGFTFSFPTKTTNVSWEGVPSAPPWKSICSSPNQKFCIDLSDDGKEIFAAEVLSKHLFILQNLASFRNLSIAEQIDSEVTKSRKGKKKKAKMHKLSDRHHHYSTL